MSPNTPGQVDSLDRWVVAEPGALLFCVNNLAVQVLQCISILNVFYSFQVKMAICSEQKKRQLICQDKYQMEIENCRILGCAIVNGYQSESFVVFATILTTRTVILPYLVW